jgi:uncharacterized protein YndB with AHSA1/START domain
VTALARPLVARTAVTIAAPAEAVWGVLTTIASIAEWDDLPDEWEGDRLALGSSLVWRRVDGGFTRLTVADFEPERHLRLSLYGSTWPLPPSAYGVGYSYSLEAAGTGTRLGIEIGDFAELSHGEDFQEAARDFADAAALKIKELAERTSRRRVGSMGQRPGLVETDPSAE